MLATYDWFVAGGFAAIGLFEQRESEEQGRMKKTQLHLTICDRDSHMWPGSWVVGWIV
jgi:hypothetical protein